MHSIFASIQEKPDTVQLQVELIELTSHIDILYRRKLFCALLNKQPAAYAVTVRALFTQQQPTRHMQLCGEQGKELHSQQLASQVHQSAQLCKLTQLNFTAGPEVYLSSCRAPSRMIL